MKRLNTGQEKQCGDSVIFFYWIIKKKTKVGCNGMERRVITEAVTEQQLLVYTRLHLLNRCKVSNQTLDEP